MSSNDLESFMLACSDLNQPARSRLFQNRPGLKDIKVRARPVAPAAAFQTSQKARDWSQLDLGDAFSQATPPPDPAPPQSAAQQAADADWDEFAEFQSCPPSAASVVSGDTSDLFSGPVSELSGPSVSGVTGGPLLSAHHHGPSNQQSGRPAPISVSGYGAAHNGPLDWATVRCPAAAEPAAAAGYTPVSALLPAAKPTRFRQGLVPLPTGPENDLADLVEVEQTAIAEASSVAGGGHLAAAGPAPDFLWLDASAAVNSGSPVRTLDNLSTLLTSAPAPVPVCGASTSPLEAAPAPMCASLVTAADDDEDFGEFVSVEEMCCWHGSLPSLDLQVATASDGGELCPLEPDRPDATRQDKYDSFRQQITSRPWSESALVSDWRRCLQACYELIQEGVSLFSSVADHHTCSEVAGSLQGAGYIDNLSRVFRVAGRIEQASERHGCRHQLDFILSETAKAWANLTAFVANSPIRTTVADSGLPAEVGAQTPYCGVCLLPAVQAINCQEPTLTCAGRPYHACCANLWVNRVADVLPALRP